MPYLVLGYRTGLGVLDPETFVQQNGTEMTGWTITGPGGTFTLEEGVVAAEMDGWDVDNTVAGVFTFESGTTEVEMSGWDIAGPA